MEKIKIYLALIFISLFYCADNFITRFVKPALKVVKSFIIKWNEFITIPLGWFLVKWSEPFITSTYPDSTRYDTGFFYDVVYSSAAGFIIHGISFVIFKINWLFVEKYLDVDLEKDFKSLAPIQRVLIALWLFQSYFWSFIVLFWIVSWTGLK